MSSRKLARAYLMFLVLVIGGWLLFLLVRGVLNRDPESICAAIVIPFGASLVWAVMHALSYGEDR